MKHLFEFHPSQFPQMSMLGEDEFYNLCYRHLQRNPKPSTWKKDHLKRFESEIKTDSLLSIVQSQQSQDGTIKFLFKLEDNKLIESVLMPFRQKWTLCVSTQVGCAMNCQFCATAKQGLQRQLSFAEIVDQVFVAKEWLKKKNDYPLTNLVFMGQGEPLHNFDEVQKAIQLLCLKKGFGFSPKKITLSTAGFLPGLQRYTKNLMGVNIALSLHSAIPKKRRLLIPLEDRYPLASITEELKKIPLGHHQFINLEYLMISGFNLGTEDIDALVLYSKQFPSIINLIPLNPYPGLNDQWLKPGLGEVESFKHELAKRGLRTFIRTTRGDEIKAACGQLKTT